MHGMELTIIMYFGIFWDYHHLAVWLANLNLQANASYAGAFCRVGMEGSDCETKEAPSPKNSKHDKPITPPRLNCAEFNHLLNIRCSMIFPNTNFTDQIISLWSKSKPDMM